MRRCDIPYEKESTRIYKQSLEEIYESAYLSIKSMGGKILNHDLEKKQLHAQMDKKLYGNVLGDRSKLEIQFTVSDGGETSIYIYAYPLNAVGQKLMFGARKGVVETVIAAFYDEMEKRLNQEK